MARYYHADPRQAAADIAHEVSISGSSTGWAAHTLAQLEAVKAALAPEGIDYVCDFHGKWEAADLCGCCDRSPCVHTDAPSTEEIEAEIAFRVDQFDAALASRAGWPMRGAL